ncbi:MAG: phytanoyl-CoA dioxygenase family protein [Pseudomonadota bacterium]
MDRFTSDHVTQWRQEGGVLIEGFFTAEEVAAVHADFERVFGDRSGATDPLDTGDKPNFDASQFNTFAAIPFDCSPALNLIGVHPELIKFAQAALGCEEVHLYQCQAWAKYTGDADYAQPFHCDFANHTLTVPAENASDNSVTILCYFTDVTEAHGPMHYVRRSDSDPLGGPDAQLRNQPGLQRALLAKACSSAAPAGTIFPYSIDVYHRGTNLTAPNGVRYAVMVCFKKAGNEAVGYHAWPFHHQQPWHNIFAHATPSQLACFGVPAPGQPFWTPLTIERAQARYPDWDMSAYADAL